MSFRYVVDTVLHKILLFFGVTLANLLTTCLQYSMWLLNSLSLLSSFVQIIDCTFLILITFCFIFPLWRHHYSLNFQKPYLRNAFVKSWYIYIYLLLNIRFIFIVRCWLVGAVESLEVFSNFNKIFYWRY